MNDITDPDFLTEGMAYQALLFDMKKSAEAAGKYFKSAYKTVNDHPGLFSFLKEHSTHINFAFGSNSIDISLAGDRETFRRFWGEIRRAGYSPGSRPKPDAKEAEFCCFWYKESYTRIWFSYSSTVCTRRQVGTKMVEQPVYETVCTDGPAISLDDPVECLPSEP